MSVNTPPGPNLGTLAGWELKTLTLIQSSFAEAAQAWLETRRPYLASRTFYDYGQYVKTLTAFFSEMRLPEIGPDEIRAYQRMRMQRAGASIINHECSALQQMLKRIGRWPEIMADYQPLKLPRESPGRALTEQEEATLLRIGATNPLWHVAYCCFVISINSSAGPGELRTLHIRDVDIVDKSFRVNAEGAKNPGRIRVIPMNDACARAFDYLLTRARELGAVLPEHYLLPFMVKKGTYDPDRPCKTWRTAHIAMCAVAGIRVRQYDFRHHAITRLLENPDVSEETCEAIAGHISHKMKKRYSHTRMKARRAAVEALQKIGRQKQF